LSKTSVPVEKTGDLVHLGEMLYQRTLRKPVTVEGVGLHSGKPARLLFRPAPSGTGIYFQRRDLPGQPTLRVSGENVEATQLATTLGGKDFSVSTIEHCLSGVAAFRIDNLIIELEGPEIPICDGSAAVFSQKILEAGFVEQDQPRKYYYVTKPILEGNEEKHVYVFPYNGLKISCTIDFKHPAIGLQSFEIDVNEQTFTREIAAARTFGFFKDAEALRAKGLALGANLDNTVVLDESGVMNPSGLRFKDEFVRHKILDALGDLVTLGFPLLGHVVLYKAGHDLMNKMVRLLRHSPASVQLTELGGLPSELPVDPQSRPS
jgi:UDP-3-O-[3-hydroxymyristoyl] N-acetylglucosamine deacetylase